MKQQNFEKTKWKFRYAHGGKLRNQRAGRLARPLSTKQSLHLVFKANCDCVRGGLRSSRRFALIHRILAKYSKRFWIKVEQISIQSDHIHLLIRAPRRAKYAAFLRVFAGQIAQQFQKEGLLSGTQNSKCNQGVTDTAPGAPSGLVRLWRYRPFSRVIVGFRAYQIVRSYVQLNELEAQGKIRYQKQRLRGLSMQDWDILWN